MDIILNEYKELPYFALIAWRFTVDKADEPVLVEIKTR